MLPYQIDELGLEGSREGDDGRTGVMGVNELLNLGQPGNKNLNLKK